MINKKLFGVGIILMISLVIIGLVIAQSSQEDLEAELAGLVGELTGSDYSWLINYSGELPGVDPAEIEVYTQDNDTLIAKFTDISDEGWYRVLLTELVGSYDVFDLRVKCGSNNNFSNLRLDDGGNINSLEYDMQNRGVDLARKGGDREQTIPRSYDKGISILDNNIINCGIEFDYIVDPTIIIEEEEIVDDSLLNNVTAEKGDANFTHLTIDNSTDVYLEFDGSGDYVDMGDPDIIEGIPSFTVCFWAKTPRTSGGADYPVSQGTTSAGVFLFEWDSGEDLKIMVHNGSQTGIGETTGEVFQDSNWHHICGLYNSTDVVVYFDNVMGGEISQSSLTGLTASTGYDLVIGNNWLGSIDSVRIYNISLNAANITEIYNSGRTANSSLYDGGNLVGWWKMDEAAGTTAADSSGEGNDGTLVGDTKWSTWALGDNLVGYWNFDGDNVNSPGNTSYDFSKEDNDGTMKGDAVVNSSNCMYGDCLQLDGGGDYVNITVTQNKNSTSLWYKNSTDSYWTYVAHNGSDYFVNGATGNPTQYPLNISGNNVKIGVNGSNYFNGTIDEVMIFNTSLTAAQISDIYNNQSARFVTEGTQKVRAVNITDSTNWDNAGYNRVNLTTTYETNMQSNISARIGQMNFSVNVSGLVLYMPFEWGSAVDISGHCYDNETEILTDEGWKYFYELKGDEKVMTLNQETGEREWQLPMEYQVFDNNGEMYKIKTEKGELLVSEKHKIYVKRLESKRLYLAFPLLLFVLFWGIGNKKREGVISDNIHNKNNDFEKRGGIR